jgi:hypothetical protein
MKAVAYLNIFFFISSLSRFPLSRHERDEDVGFLRESEMGSENQNSAFSEVKPEEDRIQI